MERIGIYGGSFDPVHLGHLLVAQAAVEEVRLDRLVFLPAARSPFKPESNPAPADLRLRMLRTALVGVAESRVDDLEIRRGGVSYTVETAEVYHRRYPEAELHYLIGADHAARLPEWKDSDRLAELLRFIVIPRPGESGRALPEGFHGMWLRGFPAAISSSQIRERRRRGLPIHWLTPPAVEEILVNNRLYL